MLQTSISKSSTSWQFCPSVSPSTGGRFPYLTMQPPKASTSVHSLAKTFATATKVSAWKTSTKPFANIEVEMSDLTVNGTIQPQLVPWCAGCGKNIGLFEASGRSGKFSSGLIMRLNSLRRGFVTIIREFGDGGGGNQARFKAYLVSLNNREVIHGKRKSITCQLGLSFL